MEEITTDTLAFAETFQRSSENPIICNECSRTWIFNRKMEVDKEHGCFVCPCCGKHKPISVDVIEKGKELKNARLVRALNPKDDESWIDFSDYSYPDQDGRNRRRECFCEF